MGIYAGPPPKLRMPKVKPPSGITAKRPRPTTSPPVQYPPMQNSYAICTEDNQCKSCGAPLLDTMDSCAWCGSKIKKILKKEVKYATKKNEELPKPYEQEKFTFLHTVESRFFNKKIHIPVNDCSSIVIDKVFINFDQIPNNKFEYIHDYEFDQMPLPLQHYVKIKQKLYPGDTVMVHFHKSHLMVCHE